MVILFLSPPSSITPVWHPTRPLSNPNTSPTAPNTGYGVPNESNSAVALLITGTLASSTTGLALLYKTGRIEPRAH